MAGEQKLGSKKRKRQSFTTNHGLVGIFTRSKSQIYVHRNRSGRARLDSLPRHLNISQPLPEKRRRVLARDSSDADDLSCTLIKDLRTRRVFSNGFVLGGENEDEKGSEKGIGISENRSSCKSLFDRDVVDTNVSEHGDNNEKLDLGLGSKDVNLDPSLLQKKRKGDEEFDVSNGVVGLDEETLQSTPPDVEVLTDNKEDENGDQKAKFIRGKHSNENINKRNTNSSRIKSVKLFKAPGSFSYRRLLPYLVDISEEKSCGPKMGQFQKLEQGREEKPYSASQSVDILINKSMRENCAAESDDVDHVNKPKSTFIERIKESPKKASMDGDFSHTSISMVEEWSKPIMDWGIERFNIKSPSQEPNLGMNNIVSAISDDIKSMNNGETAKIDVYKSSDPEIMSNFSYIVSLVPETCNSGEYSEDGQCFEDTKQSKSERLYESNEGGPSEVNNLNHTNADLPNRERTENLSDAEQRDDRGVEILDHTDNSNKEYVQMTPPDGDIIGKLEVAETGGNSGICMHNAGNFRGKPLIGNTYRNNNSIDDKTINSSPMRKQVLNRCSRLKLFKAPGSLGYRRMLPFLMDAVKDNSSVSGKGHLLILEKSFEANPISPSLVSNYQEMPVENFYGNDCHAEHQTGGHSALPIAVKTAKLNNQEYGNESPNTPHPQQERDARFEQDIPDTARKLEAGPEVMDTVHGCNLPGTSLCSLSSFRSFLREDAQQALQASSLNLEEDCNKSVTGVTNDAKQTETESLVQDSSHQATSLCLNIPATVSNKGILRRTPRGCRGLCTCMNCSSFRLHAEKAFDFSRNQMQDSEEVVLDLIKELSYLRNVLEKSAFSPDGHALVCASQVKEACIRTREAEELAQSRLSQMNFDLNIHCRVTCAERPRVTFANYVEEKIITNAEFPSTYRLIEAEKEENLC